MAAPWGGAGGPVPPDPKSRQKLSKKNHMKLIRYTFKLKTYVKISPLLLDLSELALPLLGCLEDGMI